MDLDFSQALHQLVLQGNRIDCQRCGEPATRLRLKDGIAPYGLSPSGRPLTPEEFLPQLETELEEPDHPDNRLPLDELVGYCDRHQARHIAQKPDQPGDNGAGPSERQHAQTKKFRTRVLELLDQRCCLCGRQFQVKSLEVRLRRDVAANFWAQNDLSSWADKYAYLADPEVNPADLVEAVCRFCVDVRVSGGRTAAKENLRVKVVEGYGGKCGVCDVEVAPRVAWVVRKSGFAALRHAGGVGRKLTSKQKYEKLLAEGCPGSHELRCPAHRDTDSLGAESQVVKD